ncbi:MAG: TonB-dependent receptor plug domain-containing protein, partial [Candidatus Latescibacteria bacterium]|nr:TonB-dependent receptor plug domain-containing protein [Candidatus Latescibacterota bacterium]
MKKNVFLVLCAVQFGIVSSANAQEESLTELLEVSLSELMQFDVILASGVEEPLIDAPAAMIVITKREIHQRGYIGLHEVLMDLPGFDVSVTNGTIYLTAYQRGYRTPQTQRTLLMIDGKIENHLWSQVAHFSRQYPVSNIDKIEVLYGPASAIYGPNAFLGVINVYTKNGKGLEDGQTTTEIDLLSGNFDTRSVDATTRGRFGDVDYAISGRVYKSDEPDLSDRWGFNTNTLYGSRSIWGPVLDFDNAGKVLGTYHDPTDDYGLQGSVGYKELRIGLLKWKTREGYGVYYPADRAQNNAFWENTSTHWFAEYDKELSEN